MKENNRFISLFDAMKSENKGLVDVSIQILKRMHSEDGYGIDILHQIQTYFLGPYQKQGKLNIADICSLDYERRVRFLYALDGVIQKEPAFQYTLRKIKKETSLKKLGVPTNDMVRRMAFLWAGIERQQKLLEKVLEHQKTRS